MSFLDVQYVTAPLSDPRDHRVHQPAEDPEGLHAQFLQGSQGLHPGLAQIPEPRPQGSTPLFICAHAHFLS